MQASAGLYKALKRVLVFVLVVVIVGVVVTSFVRSIFNSRSCVKGEPRSVQVQLPGSFSFLFLASVNHSVMVFRSLIVRSSVMRRRE